MPRVAWQHPRPTKFGDTVRGSIQTCCMHRGKDNPSLGSTNIN